MSKPYFVIDRLDRTPGGALYSRAVQAVKLCLMRRMFVLLPSDTCYSVATLAVSRNAYADINTLLERNKEPISLAFPDLSRVEEWVNLNNLSAILFERFTPGPITVVCAAKPTLPVEFTTQTIGSKTRTIGVRIPDSIVERQVAGCTRYLITTVAVRNPKDHEVVQDFDCAMEIVGKGMERIGNPGWGAIEGDVFYAKHSTVVYIAESSREVKLIREGHIPFADIEAVTRFLPVWSIDA